jgi:hypothetical protein
VVSQHGREAELTTFVGRGDLGAPELLDVYSSFLRAPSQLVLWDLTGANLTNHHDDLAVWGFAVMVASLAKGRRTAGRTAIVCSCPEDRRLASALIAYLRIGGYPVRVEEFADMETARSWLTEEPAA